MEAIPMKLIGVISTAVLSLAIGVAVPVFAQDHGYWFGFEGAWPSNWLYTQDVYVVEINGVYYLCNPMILALTLCSASQNSGHRGQKHN
jgi:hypothetical protein